MYWTGSNCDVELLSVCVFVLLSACVCLCAAKMFKVCPCPFFLVHVDTCSTTEFKSWVPTRSGVFTIWRGCKLVFFCSVLFCCFYLHYFSFNADRWREKIKRSRNWFIQASLPLSFEEDTVAFVSATSHRSCTRSPCSALRGSKRILWFHSHLRCTWLRVCQSCVCLHG